DLVGRIGAQQPRPGECDLVANAEAVLRVLGADAVFLEGLDRGHLEGKLLAQILAEEERYAERAAICRGGGVVEFRVAGEGVGLKVDTDVLENARAVAVHQRLRIAEADEEVGVRDYRARARRDQAVLRDDGIALVVLAIPEVREEARRVR